MTTQQLFTVTLSTGETVLAKKHTESKFSGRSGLMYEPLRYGNLSAAQKKLDVIQPLLSPYRSASIVKLDGRFLILIYDKPGYQTIHSAVVHKMLDSQFKPNLNRCRLFATTSGPRCNPRNRHNHAHKDQTDQPYYFGE